MIGCAIGRPAPLPYGTPENIAALLLRPPRRVHLSIGDMSLTEGTALDILTRATNGA